MTSQAQDELPQVDRHTVEYCLLVLAGHTRHQTVSGFNAFDLEMGHVLAERIRLGRELTGKQRRAAHRMLAKYADQLARADVDYHQVPVPEDHTPAPNLQQVRREQPQLTVDSGRIVVRSPFALKDICASIPGGRWNPRTPPRGAWTYPESPRSAVAVFEAFAAHDPVTDEGFEVLLGDGRRMRDARQHAEADGLPPIPGESMSSWNHQRQAFWFLRELDAGMAWMEMGTGKSKVTVDLIRDAGDQRVLIICPAKVLGVWPKQFRLHGGLDPVSGRVRTDLFHVDNGFVTVGRGDAARREADTVENRTRGFDQLLHECGCGKPHVCVINYEATAFEPFKTWALEQQWDRIVLDESHRVRAPQGVWSKWVARARSTARRRLCLTGTMLGQDDLDVFGQYRFLDNGIFGNSYTSFANRYAVHGGYEGHEVVALRTRPHMKGSDRPNPNYSPPLAREFDEKLFSICYRVGDEVLDLPPAHTIVRTFDLPPAARRHYRELDEDLYTELQSLARQAPGGGQELPESEVSAPNVLVKMLRLQQLTGGHITDDAGEVLQVHTGKRDLLLDVLEDISPDENVVVFCRFIPDLATVEEVAAKLKRPYAELSGGRDDGLTEDSTLALEHGITGVQIQAGGVGVDFTAARHSIDYSVGFSLIDYQQSRRRLHRPGQEHPVTFIQLVAERTIDVDVYQALAANEQAVNYVAQRRLRDAAGGAWEE